MIRHIAATAAIAISVGTLSSCNQPTTNTEKPVAQAAPAEASSDIVVKATALVDQVIAGKYGPVVAEFDATMADAMPESLLATTMEQLGQQLGSFKKRTDTRVAEEQGFDVVYITMIFEKATVNAKVVYDAEGKVAGLFFQP